VIWPVLYLLVLGQEITPNHDARRAADALSAELTRLSQMEETPLQRIVLTQILSDLERSIRRDHESRVAVKDGPSLELDAKSEILFVQTPKLPPEIKRNGTWQFQPIRLDLVPKNLYVYSLRFKGSHTIRIRSVTLHFKTGPPVIHDTWKDMEHGNGRAFSKRSFSPVLNAWREGEQRVARILTAIEILGSAQDSVFESYLDFALEVPEPQSKPYEKALSLVSDLKKDLSANELDAVKIAQGRALLREILEILDPQ